MNPFAWSGLLAGLSSSALAFIVYAKTPSKRLAQSWALYALAVAMWGFGSMAVAICSDPGVVIWIWRLADIFGVMIIPPLFYHFVCIFCEIERKNLIAIHYALMVISLISAPSRLFLTGTRWVFGSFYYTTPGPIYPFCALWWCISIFYSHYELLKSYRVSVESKRNQIRYFLFATIVGFSGGSLCYLPALGLDVYPWGNFAIPVYSSIMSYAIVKHRLMDIEVFIRKTVLYVCLLLLAVAGYVVFIAHFTHRAILPLANFSILTSVLSVGMALFTLIKAPRKRMSIMWILTCLSIATWSFGFGMMTRSHSYTECIFWQKWFLYVGSIMIPVVYLHFVSLLVGIDIPRVLQASYAGALVFEILNIAGRLATAKIKPPFYFYTHAIYPLYHVFTAFFFAIAIYAHWLLLWRMKTAEGALRNQIQYIFIGTSIGFVGGCMTFPLSFDIHIFPIGTYLVAFYLLAVTYAMYKHHLMDINVVLRKSLVYSFMTGMLTAVYLVAITRGAHIMQNVFGATTTTISVIIACLVAAGFLPLRNKVQSFVDRYFFRDWADQPVAREIAAGFSHELKSPLAGLSMQAQLALAELEEVEEGRTAWMKALPRIKQQLQYLVNQSMDAARRIEAVRGVAEPTRGQLEPVQVSELIDNSLSCLQFLVGESKVVVQRDLPGSLAPVYGDAKQLEIVFINLMKNAIQAMGTMNGSAEHRLILSGHERNGSIWISIQDTGPGIAPRDVGRIFEPYFTTKGHRGTGMGLYLAQQIVKAHGGTIEVRSEEGKGTEFIVKLPTYKTLPSQKDANAAA